MTELPPLDRELVELIDHAPRATVPDAALSRLRARLGSEIPGFLPIAAAPTPGLPVHPRFWQSPVRVGLIMFATGVGVGAVGHARWSAPVVEPVTVVNAPAPPAPAPTPPAPAPAIPAPPVVTPAAPPARPVPAVVHPAAAPEHLASGRDTALATERALIEIARTALARRDVAGCFEALRKHLAQFRGGQLVEERESLWVQALVNDGRTAAATARADAFRARFPHSLLLPLVDAALRPIP